MRYQISSYKVDVTFIGNVLPYGATEERVVPSWAWSSRAGRDSGRRRRWWVVGSWFCTICWKINFKDNFFSSQLVVHRLTLIRKRLFLFIFKAGDFAKYSPVSEFALDVVVLVRVLAHLHQLALHVVQVHRRPVGGSADGGRYLNESEAMRNVLSLSLANGLQEKVHSWCRVECCLWIAQGIQMRNGFPEKSPTFCILIQTCLQSRLSMPLGLLKALSPGIFAPYDLVLLQNN